MYLKKKEKNVVHCGRTEKLHGSNFEHICHISKNNQSLKFIVMNDFYKTIKII